MFHENVSYSNGDTEEKRNQTSELLKEFQDIFKICPDLSILYTCSFSVSEYVPFKTRPHPVPFARRPVVEAEIQRILDWGVVELCLYLYSSPIICIGK